MKSRNRRQSIQPASTRIGPNRERRPRPNSSCLADEVMTPTLSIIIHLTRNPWHRGLPAEGIQYLLYSNAARRARILAVTLLKQEIVHGRQASKERDKFTAHKQLMEESKFSAEKNKLRNARNIGASITFRSIYCRKIPSLLIRDSSVVGFKSSVSAAPPWPRMRHPVRCNTR